MDTTCKICGVQTPNDGTKLCDNCWEINRRLDQLLNTPSGRDWLVRRLNQKLETVHEHLHRIQK